MKNLDKVWWPEEGITKGDVLDHYHALADVIVPHLRGRPFTMLRYPDGIAGNRFFQKDAPKAHARLGAAGAAARGRPHDPLPGAGRRAVAALGDQHGLHRPERLVRARGSPRAPGRGDLRPRPGGARRASTRRARSRCWCATRSPRSTCARTRARAARYAGCTCWCRSPAATRTRRRASSWRRSGAALAHAHPGLVTTKWAKTERKGVLIDANQNGYGRTTAWAYSVRPRPGALVATPVTWEELEQPLDHDAVHDGGGAGSGSRVSATCTGRCWRTRSRSGRRSRRCAEAARWWRFGRGAGGRLRALRT